MLLLAQESCCVNNYASCENIGRFWLTVGTERLT
jgi:hypothetical protein